MPRLREGIGTEVSQARAAGTPTIETAAPLSSTATQPGSAPSASTIIDERVVARASWRGIVEPPPREAVTFRRLEQLEGLVLEVDSEAGTFRARLVDPRGGQPDQEADLDMEQLALSDRALVRRGALFYWTVGYRTRGRRRELALAVEFRRFPKLSRAAGERAAESAASAYIEAAGWSE